MSLPVGLDPERDAWDTVLDAANLAAGTNPVMADFLRVIQARYPQVPWRRSQPTPAGMRLPAATLYHMIHDDVPRLAPQISTLAANLENDRGRRMLRNIDPLRVDRPLREIPVPNPPPAPENRSPNEAASSSRSRPRGDGLPQPTDPPTPPEYAALPRRGSRTPPRRAELPSSRVGPACDDCDLTRTSYCRRCRQWVCTGGRPRCARILRCACAAQERELWSATPSSIRQHTVCGRFLDPDIWRPDVEWMTISASVRAATEATRQGMRGVITGLEQLLRPDVGVPSPPSMQEINLLVTGLRLLADQIAEGVAAAVEEDHVTH